MNNIQNIQGKNIVISMKRTSDVIESSLEKTHTIPNDGTFTVRKDDSLQHTFVVIKDPDECLQTTFTKETVKNPESSSNRPASLQGTFVKQIDEQNLESATETQGNPADIQDNSASLKSTFIKSVDGDGNESQV